MNPKDALHQQELLREACSRPKMQDYLSTVVNDIRAKDNGPVVINKRGFVDGPTVGQNLQRLLTNAETFYVSEDMTAVAQMAAHGLDGTDRFTHDMWPADTGFLLFDRGYVPWSPAPSHGSGTPSTATRAPCCGPSPCWATSVTR